MAGAIGRIRWTARLAWARADERAFASAAAVALWVGLAFMVNKPLRHEIDALRSNAAALAVAPAEPAMRRAAEPGSPARIDAFLAFLPPVDVREQQLQTLHGLAAESGVALSRIEYAHSGLQHLPVRRLSMQMSVVAGYAPCRKFLHSLLAGMPNLAIDRIAMEKSPEEPDRLIVRLEASLYYRQAGDASSR